jgi:S1-C subfamily serine protease
MSTYLDNFDNYDVKFPELILEILEYFSNRAHIDKYKESDWRGPIYDFIEKYAVESSHSWSGKEFLVQPKVVARICAKLCDLGIMERIRSYSSFEDRDDFRHNLTIAGWRDTKTRMRISHYYNSRVYGFDYIHRAYKDKVFPIVYENEEGDYSIGTGFEFFGGIATAKHCLIGAKSISIKGYSKAELTGKMIYVHENPNIDIAYVHVGRSNYSEVFIEDAEVMQEVLTMGYPKIPQFTDFLTAELACVSSIAEGRITPTKGSVAAIAESYMARIELILITAKIRGGNSGGPVINGKGSIVGIACANPIYEDCGDYDDLGYGIVVPIKYLNEIFKDQITFNGTVNFKDFE